MTNSLFWRRNLLNNCAFIICLFLPLALVSGPFLSDFIISLTSIICLFIILKKKKYFYILNKYTYFFLIWYFYLIYCSLLSDDPFFSLESSLFYFRFGLFTISIFFLIEQNKKFIHYFSYFFIFTYCVLLFDGYFQFFYKKNILGNIYDGYRLSGLFGEEKILGSFLARNLPLLFALSMYSFEKNKKLLIFLSSILVLSDILIYITGERAAFFYLVLFSLITVFLLNEWKKIRLITLIISTIVIVVINFTNERIYNRVIISTLTEINILKGDSKLSEDNIIFFSPPHQKHFESALSIFKNNFLIGSGPKMFRKVCLYETNLPASWAGGRAKMNHKSHINSGCATHPHNTYMQLLAETGIFGFLFIFIIFLYVLKIFLSQFFYLYFLKKSYISDYKLCLYCGLLITLWPFVPTGNFFHNWLNIIYFLPLGFLIHSTNLNRNNL